MLYLALKLVHLIALILWMGPPLGAYSLLIAAHRSHDRARIVWTERQVERVLVVEHIAFPLLIASGIAMIALVGVEGALTWPWLRWKLVAVAGIVLFELFDIWVSHRVFSAVLRVDDPFAHPGFARAQLWRKRLALAALPIAFLLLPATLSLAVLKPAL